MKLQISNCKKAAVQDGMIGLFFEDINYAADGGLYAEMIENRSFSFVDCYGDVGDYYTKPAWGYGWNATKECGEGRMEYVTGSPISRVNPWYLRFTAQDAGQGFWNKAYDGIYLEKGKTYTVRFYARAVQYPEGDITAESAHRQRFPASMRRRKPGRNGTCMKQYWKPGRQSGTADLRSA